MDDNLKVCLDCGDLTTGTRCQPCQAERDNGSATNAAAPPHAATPAPGRSGRHKCDGSSRPASSAVPLTT